MSSPVPLCSSRTAARVPEPATCPTSGDTAGSSWHRHGQSRSSANRRWRTGSWPRQKKKNPSLCFKLVASRMNLAHSQHLFKHLVLLRTVANPWGFVPRKCPALYSCSLLSLNTRGQNKYNGARSTLHLGVHKNQTLLEGERTVSACIKIRIHPHFCATVQRKMTTKRTVLMHSLGLRDSTAQKENFTGCCFARNRCNTEMLFICH